MPGRVTTGIRRNNKFPTIPLARIFKGMADDSSSSYASGYSAEVADKDFPLEEGVNFLTKPFEAHKLAQVVRNILDKPA
jgi:hypothetical protein